MKKQIYLLIIFIIIYSCDKPLNKEVKSIQFNKETFVDTKESIKNIYLNELEKNKSNFIELTNLISFTKQNIVPFKNIIEKNSINNYKDLADKLICFENGSSKGPNKIGIGTGGTLYIRFTNANWSTGIHPPNILNTCGNYKPSTRRFTFPSKKMYQYQMVIFEDAPGARTYFTGVCEEDKTYYIKTKKGFTYYVYTNDTDGDHDDNRGNISYCYAGGVY